jgi:glycosyltransferase involved in cell wall biosynthesis
MKKRKKPEVTIIIPLHIVTGRFFDDLKKVTAIGQVNYETIVVSDRKISQLRQIRNVKYLTMKSPGTTSPAEKRDYALRFARAEICAFIDDDAYPDNLWLKNAIHHFVQDPNLVGVGGPGLTPPEDPLMARLGGYVYESDFTSGKLKYRFTNVGQKPSYVKDWPAYNLFIRKKFLSKVNGWGSSFYGGEDTYVCLKLLPHGRILYDPNVIVYHHRRPLFLPHMKQIFNVGTHRGYFFKRYPETSRSIFYFLPTILTFGLIMAAVTSLMIRAVMPVFFLALIFAVIAGGLSIRRDIGFFERIVAGAGIITTHMAYGTGFVKGLLVRKLDR